MKVNFEERKIMEMSALPSSMPFADLLARTFNGVINYSRTVPPLSTSTIWLRNSIKLKIVHSCWAEILRIILLINEHLLSGISASKYITIRKGLMWIAHPIELRKHYKITPLTRTSEC